MADNFDSLLIGEVEVFPLIYNMKLEEYRNLSLKEKAWREIMANLISMGCKVAGGLAWLVVKGCMPSPNGKTISNNFF